MAWNRPKVCETPVKTTSAKHSWLWVTLVLVALAAVGLISWLFVGGEPEREKPDAKARKIAEVKTTKATRQKAEVPHTITPTNSVAKPVDATFSATTENKQVTKEEKKEKVVPNPEPRPEYAIFDHEVENEIASYLAIRPGQVMVGTPRYKDDLDQQFLESLKNPIIVTQDDSDYVKWLKRSMNETKIAIKDELDQGKHLKDILIESRREYQKLNIYKRDLQFEIGKLRRQEGVTEEDIGDMIKAANIMLKEKGIDPIQVGALTTEKLKSDAERPDEVEY